MARQTGAEVTLNKNRWMLETFLFPEIGTLPLADITPRVLLDALRKIEATGKLETVSRTMIKAGQVFRYAVLEGKAESDPTASLRGALKRPRQSTMQLSRTPRGSVIYCAPSTASTASL
ncbi:MAG: hypothetical protein LBQ20_02795 [Rhodanobacter sp.]|jgi:integrase|nr:hypothetical protein [Rhodanobacter sp.]